MGCAFVHLIRLQELVEEDASTRLKVNFVLTVPDFKLSHAAASGAMRVHGKNQLLKLGSNIAHQSRH